MMNYLRYISIFMGLFFVSLICISSSFAISPVDLEFSDLGSNLTISVNDSANIKSDLKNLNSLDTHDLDESILKSDEYKFSNKNIYINNCSMDLNYSSNINSVNAISGNTFTDIQNAINNAKNGDNIVLNNIVYSGKGSFISVNKSVNIIGNGAILDGKVIEGEYDAWDIVLGQHCFSLTNEFDMVPIVMEGPVIEISFEVVLPWVLEK